jgi:hypothetical protein
VRRLRRFAGWLGEAILSIGNPIEAVAGAVIGRIAEGIVKGTEQLFRRRHANPDVEPPPS